MTALKERNTKELVPRPEGKNILPNKMILKLKRHADGTVDKYKARLVVLGYTQIEEEYDLLYSPVLDFVAVRLALTLSGTKNMIVHKMDVSNAFLHGDIYEDLYIAQPKGLEDNDKKDYVFKLRKSSYGLKQAPRVWYCHLHKKLVSFGFRKLNHL